MMYQKNHPIAAETLHAGRARRSLHLAGARAPGPSGQKKSKSMCEFTERGKHGRKRLLANWRLAQRVKDRRRRRPRYFGNGEKKSEERKRGRRVKKRKKGPYNRSARSSRIIYLRSVSRRSPRVRACGRATVFRKKKKRLEGGENGRRLRDPNTSFYFYVHTLLGIA